MAVERVCLTQCCMSKTCHGSSANIEWGQNKPLTSLAPAIWRKRGWSGRWCWVGEETKSRSWTNKSAYPSGQLELPCESLDSNREGTGDQPPRLVLSVKKALLCNTDGLAQNGVQIVVTDCPSHLPHAGHGRTQSTQDQFEGKWTNRKRQCPERGVRWGRGYAPHLSVRFLSRMVGRLRIASRSLPGCWPGGRRPRLGIGPPMPNMPIGCGMPGGPIPGGPSMGGRMPKGGPIPMGGPCTHNCNRCIAPANQHDPWEAQLH